MGLQRFWACVALIVGMIGMFGGRALAMDAIPNNPENKRWHVSDKTLTATFLGGDKPEPAVLLLSKTAGVGQAMTITSDGNYIVLQSGDSPHIVFQIPPNPDGTTTKFLLTGGDQPTLFFNGKEQVTQQGKWIQIMGTPDVTIHVEIGEATFAKIIFDPPAGQKPQPVAEGTLVKSIPTASKEMLHVVTPTSLSGAVNAFEQGVSKKCPRCNGSGKETVSVQTGTRQNGIMSFPTYSERTQECSKCHGTGVDRSSDAVLIKLAGILVKDMAFVNQTDERTQAVLTSTYKEITDKMIGDQKTWTALTANGKSILAQPSPVPGTTVVSLVEVKKSIKRDDTHRRYLVRVIGTDKQVYVDDPTLADELHSGHALMGGMVDESILAENGTDRMTVLHGGFLIAPAVTHDWWWWYRD